MEADNGASSGLISAATKYFNSVDECVLCRALAIGWLAADVTGSDGAAKVLRFLQLMIKPFSVCIVAPNSKLNGVRCSR